MFSTSQISYSAFLKRIQLLYKISFILDDQKNTFCLIKFCHIKIPYMGFFLSKNKGKNENFINNMNIKMLQNKMKLLVDRIFPIM